MSVSIRAARLEEVPYLQQRLSESPKWEQVDLQRSIVYVAEDEGEVVGFISGRLIWQIEPLFLFPETMRGTPHTRRRASILLHRELEGWIADRTRNRTGIYSYFAHITNRVVMKLGEHLGFHRIYKGGRLYAKDV